MSEGNKQFEGVSTGDIVALMMGCAMSNDPTDRQFSKDCAEELKRRKPELRYGNNTQPLSRSKKRKASR